MATGGTLKPIPGIAARAHQGADVRRPQRPREDLSWGYWRRLAERLDPEFAS